jgi:hypothetical protein
MAMSYAFKSLRSAEASEKAIEHPTVPPSPGLYDAIDNAMARSQLRRCSSINPSLTNAIHHHPFKDTAASPPLIAKESWDERDHLRRP